VIARAAGFAVVAFFIVGPLTSLAVWSVAERWTYPSAWPQSFGLRYWSRVASGDFLEPLRLGVFIAVIVTVIALAMAIPLG
jgi:putative spermidine/putrescine transport system permease protein